MERVGTVKEKKGACPKERKFGLKVWKRNQI